MIALVAAVTLFGLTARTWTLSLAHRRLHALIALGIVVFGAYRQCVVRPGPVLRAGVMASS